MKLALYLSYLLFILIPGLLLLFGSLKVKKKVLGSSGVLLVVGSIFIVFHLILSTGTNLLSLFGDAQSLRDYAITNAWLSGGTQYMGLVLLAIGLLLIKSPQTQK